MKKKKKVEKEGIKGKKKLKRDKKNKKNTKRVASDFLQYKIQIHNKITSYSFLE